jgi:Cytochrome c554 and c-prime
MGCWFASSTPAPVLKPDNSGTPDALKPFGTWPMDVKPDLVFALTGQTYGYLSPCGCSRPQKGGLERRYNYINSLKAKGWPVVGLDLGDIAPPKGVPKQNLLKYKAAMESLASMGYVAVGLGEYDFSSQLFDLLSSYTLNRPNKPPFILSANLQGVQRDNAGKVTKTFTREEFFSGGDPKDRPMIDAFEIVARPGQPTFAVVSVIGPTVAEKIVSMDKQYDFPRDKDNSPTSAAIIQQALAKIDQHPAKPEFKVLMYVGKMEEAKNAATAFPQFQMILCQSDDSEPPMYPTLVNNGKTRIVQVGHKGQSIVVVGLFRQGDSFDIKHQLTTLGEEWLTPENPEAEKNHEVLGILQGYAQAVKDQNLLAQHVAKKIQHSAQIHHPDAKLEYVGPEMCAKCHQAEYTVWKSSKHSHAYEALEEKYSKRPTLRQFDGECLICHTTGFDYQTGFEDATKTDHLKHNSCENCHGPGSAHSKAPLDKTYYPMLAAWKTKPTDKMPDLATIKKLGEIKEIDRGNFKLPADQRAVADAVSNMCRKCHDGENDPKFDLYQYFPKIYHSNLKNAGLPAGAK